MHALLQQGWESANPGSFTADERTSHTYYANDRLLTEIKDAPGTSDDRNLRYTYAGTQQASKFERVGTTIDQGTIIKETTYEYDTRGRLHAVTLEDGTATTVTQYKYNHSSVRVEQSVTVDSGTPVVTTYHIDPQNHTGYAKAIEEIVDGDLERSYTHGHTIISQTLANGDTHSFLHDGHGSTRVLADEAGDVIERYAYDAYGETLVGAGLTSAGANGGSSQALRQNYANLIGVSGNSLSDIGAAFHHIIPVDVARISAMLKRLNFQIDSALNALPVNRVRHAGNHWNYRAGRLRKSWSRSTNVVVRRRKSRTKS